jgi:hypothetical protein
VRELLLGRRSFLQLGFVRDVVARPANESPAPWHIPDVALRTRAGESVRFYGDLVRDHIVVIHLPCTEWDGQERVSKNLERVHDLLNDRFGRHVWLLSVSKDVDVPRLDRPPACTAGAGVHERWLSLTGDQHALETIRRAIGAWDADSVRDEDGARFAGLLTLGSDRTGRWASLPALLEPADVVTRVCRLDQK